MNKGLKKPETLLLCIALPLMLLFGALEPAYWIDKNGYLHFTTALAGDIVICEVVLVRK